MKKQLEFIGIKCDVDTSKKYQNGRSAIVLTDSEDGSGVAYASINMPDIDLNKDEVIIKDYSENKGMLDVLVDASIISEPIRSVAVSTFVKAPVCKLLK